MQTADQGLHGDGFAGGQVDHGLEHRAEGVLAQHLPERRAGRARGVGAQRGHPVDVGTLGHELEPERVNGDAPSGAHEKRSTWSNETR